jgi:hypothetical protein
MDGCIRKEGIPVSSDELHRNRDKDRASRGNLEKESGEEAKSLTVLEFNASEILKVKNHLE